MTKKVIWAEQHEEMRATLRDMFLSRAQKLGVDVQVDSVEKPEELVRMVLADNSYDLAITYQGVSGLSGLDASRQIRAENPVIPVYICSMMGCTPYRLAECGVTGYIAKSCADFKGVLDKVIETHLKLGKTHQDM